MKKTVTVTITSEIEVDTNCYVKSTNKYIEEEESDTYREWAFDPRNIKEVKVSVKKV